MQTKNKNNNKTKPKQANDVKKMKTDCAQMCMRTV